MSIKWHNRYLHLAETVRSWSKDTSTKVGSVIVGEHGQILSTGYNGFPRKIEDKQELIENREEKYKRTIHAEMNAIFNASLTGISLENSTLYVSGLPPCSKCALGIIQSGISCVVVSNDDCETLPDRWKEDCEFSETLFTEAGVTVLKI